MNVLILPFDIASKGAITLDALNTIPGIEARGIFVNGIDLRRTVSRNSIIIPVYEFRRNPFKWALSYLKKTYFIIKLIIWADVLHWIWDSAFLSRWDLWLVKLLKKPGIIEWSGSDIRYPEKAVLINPYMIDIYNRGYEYSHIESKSASDNVQERFARLGFIPLSTPEMNLYVRQDLFPKSFTTLHRLNMDSFQQVAEKNPRLVVVHSPTRRVAKGTSLILAAIEELKCDIDFDFILVENLTRADALRQVQHCDIFIDQLILGSYGLASCEAMAYGKPVLCYIMPSVFENGLPKSCPIVNVTIETIKDKLRELLLDESMRLEIGNQSRMFAVSNFDANKTAAHFMDIYTKVLDMRTRK